MHFIIGVVATYTHLVPASFCICCIYSLVDIVAKVPPSVQVPEAHVREVCNEEGAIVYSLLLYSSN